MQARRVEPRLVRVAGLRNENERGDHRDDGDRYEGDEDRRPAVVGEQQAAGYRADRDTEAGDGAPDADRLRPLAAGRGRRW